MVELYEAKQCGECGNKFPEGELREVIVKNGGAPVPLCETCLDNHQWTLYKDKHAALKVVPAAPTRVKIKLITGTPEVVDAELTAMNDTVDIFDVSVGLAAFPVQGNLAGQVGIGALLTAIIRYMDIAPRDSRDQAPAG